MTDTRDPAFLLLDIYRIQQILNRYVIAVDTQAFDPLESCFTADAGIHLAGVGTMTPAQYRDICQTNLPTLDATHHFLSPPAIEVDGDTAFSRCYFTAQHVRNSAAPDPFLVIGGWYDDRLVRVGDDWRIADRTGTAVWYQGNAGILGYQVPPGALERTPGRDCPAWLMRPAN